MINLSICKELFRNLPLLLMLFIFVASPLNSRVPMLNLTQQEEEHKGQEEGTSEVYKALEISRATQIQEIQIEHIHIYEGKPHADHSYTNTPLHKNLAIYNLTLRAPPVCS